MHKFIALLHKQAQAQAMRVRTYDAILLAHVSPSVLQSESLWPAEIDRLLTQAREEGLSSIDIL